MQYINIHDLKKKLDRSENNIYKLCEQGIIPKPVRIGGKNLWREDLVDKAIDKLAAQQDAGWDKFEGGQA